MEDPFQHQNSQPDLSHSSLSVGRTNKLWLLLGGIFLLVLIGLGVYWFINRQDKILSLVPLDTVVYVRAQNSLWPWVKTKISDLPFNNFYRQIEATFNWPAGSFKNDIMAKSSKLALLFIPNQNENQLDWVLLIESRDEQVSKTIAQLPNHLFLAKHLMAFTDSPVALQKLAAVKAGKIFPLATNINIKKTAGHFISGYFNSDNIKNYLDQSNLAAKIFSAFGRGNFYLTLDPTRSGFKFTIEGDQSFDADNSDKQILVKYLPNDFSFFNSGLSWSNLFSIWTRVDPGLSKTLAQTQAAFAAIYNFDLANSLTGLLTKPVDLIIFPAKTANFFGLDFIVSFPAADNNLNQLEKLINIVLAQKQPTEVKRLLPDGSQVTELLADPESFIWQEQVFAKRVIRYVSEPKLNFEIGYATLDNQILLASSVERLKDFLANKKTLAVSDLASRCGFSSDIGLGVLNPQNLNWSDNYYLSTGKILIQPSGPAKLLGCLIDF